MIDLGYKHEDIIALVKKGIASNTLSHALLIYGEPGSGKTFLSNEIAKIILNDSADKGVNFTHIDLKTIDEAMVSESNVAQNRPFITVDEVRKIKNWLSFTAFKSKYKVVLINDTDTMNLNASNAFLKILEEPIGNAIILLNTSKISSLPLTLKSRCIKIKLRKKTQKEFTNILSEIFSSKTSLELEQFYGICNGDINLAITLIKNDQFDFSTQLSASDHYAQILKYMSQFNLDNHNQFKIFNHLVHYFYSQIIVAKINDNRQLQESFFPCADKIKNILSNISHLNKIHTKELVLNILKTCVNI
jgi:DNA polymerase III delta prime subunit